MHRLYGFVGLYIYLLMIGSLPCNNQGSRGRDGQLNQIDSYKKLCRRKTYASSTI